MTQWQITLTNFSFLQLTAFFLQKLIAFMKFDQRLSKIMLMYSLIIEKQVSMHYHVSQEMSVFLLTAIFITKKQGKIIFIFTK